MLKIISFAVSGAFAAFRDPSVTSNQTVYFIPSKTATIGLLGALIGINRTNVLGDSYGKEYLEFFKNTKIGLEMETENPKKVTMFTNHRSLKKTNKPFMKPFKTELLENPKYRIFIKTTEPYFSQLDSALRNNLFKYSPYFGHAYCPANVSDFFIHNSQYVEPEKKITKSVVLDESEPYSPNIIVTLRAQDVNSTMIVERHLHHYFKDNRFESKVIKHWIPINHSKFKFTEISGSTLSEFVEIDGLVVSLF